ncbi:MAG: pknD 4 [Mucilaginibacter sp.]|nr:pknD 4 [Mucilaginibacter sp.]
MEKTFTFIRPLLKLTVVTLILLLSTGIAYAQTTYDWIGSTSSWATASNWSPAGVPAANDIVQIGVTVTYTNAPVVASTETDYAGSITFGTKKTSPSLTISGTLTVNGNISMTSSATITMDANTACILNLAGSMNNGGTLKPSLFANSKIVLNGTVAQYLPNSTKLSGNIGVLDIQNTYNGSTTDRGVTLNNTSGSNVVINHLIVENNAIFNANATLTEGTNYYSTIGANATYISKSLFNFHANDVIDPTATLEFTATNQTINLYKPNAGLTNIPPNVLFTGTNITINGGTSPNNTPIFNILGNLTVQNTTNAVTFDPALTLINIDGDFKGSGALSSGTLPINIAGSWLNTASYNVGGNVTYDGNNASTSPQMVATGVNYQKDIIFTGASPKQVTAGTLNAGGNVDNSAGTNVDFITNSTTLLMDGSGTQYIKGGTAVNSTYPGNIVNGTVYNNITVMTTGANPQVILQGKNNIAPQGILTLSSSPGILNATSSNSLTLLSDATGSANVAAIPSGSSISGTVNVQRYLTGNNSNSYRSYRFLSSPVYTNSAGSVNYISLAYLNATVNGVNGAFTAGPGGTGNGFSIANGNPTIYLYKESLPISNTSFVSGKHVGIYAITGNTVSTVSNATGPVVITPGVSIPAGNGYLLYFIGPNTRTDGSTSLAPANATLTALGNLNQGDVPITLWYTPAGGSSGQLSYTSTLPGPGFNMVGNPYACTLDLSKVISDNAAGIDNIYILDPTGPSQYYTAYTANGSSAPSLGYAVSGEGFIVHATAAGKTLTFHESEKAATRALTGILMGKPTNEPALAGLYMKLEQDSIHHSYCGIYFRGDWSDKFEAGDAIDMNSYSPLAVASLSADGIPAAVNHMPDYTAGSRIKLYTNAATDGAYTIKIEGIRNIDTLRDIWLIDHYKNDSLNIRRQGSYAFNIVKSDTASYGNNRFVLAIRLNPAYIYQLLDFTAQRIANSTRVQAIWKTRYEQNYTNFTVERSTDGGTTFTVIGGLKGTGRGNYSLLDKAPFIGQNLYRLKQEDINNTVTYSKVVEIQYAYLTDKLNPKISVFPNPTADVINLQMDPGLKVSAYHVSIINSLGAVVKESTFQQTSWNANVSNLKPGSYLVQVTNNNDKSLVGIANFVKN